jgi:hypothetical protein
MIQFFIFLRTLKKYFELKKLRVLVKIKNMNKTTLSPIIAGTMNWEFGIKPNIEGNAKHDSCLLRKQNYHL